MHIGHVREASATCRGAVGVLIAVHYDAGPLSTSWTRKEDLSLCVLVVHRLSDRCDPPSFPVNSPGSSPLLKDTLDTQDTLLLLQSPPFPELFHHQADANHPDTSHPMIPETSLGYSARRRTYTADSCTLCVPVISRLRTGAAIWAGHLRLRHTLATPPPLCYTSWKVLSPNTGRLSTTYPALPDLLSPSLYIRWYLGPACDQSPRVQARTASALASHRTHPRPTVYAPSHLPHAVPHRFRCRCPQPNARSLGCSHVERCRAWATRTGGVTMSGTDRVREDTSVLPHLTGDEMRGERGKGFTDSGPHPSHNARHGVLRQSMLEKNSNGRCSQHLLRLLVECRRERSSSVLFRRVDARRTRRPVTMCKLTLGGGVLGCPSRRVPRKLPQAGCAAVGLESGHRGGWKRGQNNKKFKETCSIQNIQSLFSYVLCVALG
ncbi:hypothetical protein DFH06DRAFT_1126333 [Mycena polygramma]|nr:hypothetical protein DFH06DRAFT_1126333 [Mycena polygramma]